MLRVNIIQVEMEEMPALHSLTACLIKYVRQGLEIPGDPIKSIPLFRFKLNTKYQPSGAGGPHSPPAKSKMAARGPQNGRWGLERCLPLGFWAW